jgi:hypothetical protein
MLLLHIQLDDMKTKHKQWVVTDRTTLMNVPQQSDEFIENLVPKMPEMTHHHKIARQQAMYLKELKENLLSH